MHRQLSTLVIAFFALVACSPKQTPVDEALRQDLSLASQAFSPQQFVSPLEAGYAQNGYVQPGYGAAAPQQAVYRTAPRVVYRRAPATSSSGGGTRVVKNTKRDAAIGAAAGAAIGAVTSAKKDRLKGAVLGAAVGAVLGGVIGNNTDVKRIPQ